jgi:hypothetical protein
MTAVCCIRDRDHVRNPNQRMLQLNGAEQIMLQQQEHIIAGNERKPSSVPCSEARRGVFLARAGECMGRL